jgi:hypothetical protein
MVPVGWQAQGDYISSGRTIGTADSQLIFPNLAVKVGPSRHHTRSPSAALL